jgi:LPXTG-site transpeptidase (sortase) family protein
MPAPTGPNQVLYYDFSIAPGFGGAIGQGGNAVFAGHVDFHDCGNGKPCLAVFANMLDAKKGDKINVTVSGTTYVYQITDLVDIDMEKSVDLAVFTKYMLSTSNEVVTVITCKGEFKNGEYTKRLLVRAERIS